MKLTPPALLLFTAVAVLSGAACELLMIGSPEPTSTQISLGTGVVASPSPARTDHPPPTQTLAPLHQNMRVSGEITAKIGGETRSWYTVLSPGIGGALVNSATWSDDIDAAGFYEADLQALGFQNQSYQQATSTLRLQFPFTPDMEPGTIIRVAGPSGDRASAELKLEGPGWSYEMVEGKIELERLTVRAEQAAFSGVFMGTVELVGVAQGEPPWPEKVEVEAGRIQIIRATAKSALPGARSPQNE